MDFLIMMMTVITSISDFSYDNIFGMVYKIKYLLRQQICQIQVEPHIKILPNI